MSMDLASTCSKMKHPEVAGDEQKIVKIRQYRSVFFVCLSCTLSRKFVMMDADKWSAVKLRL